MHSRHMMTGSTADAIDMALLRESDRGIAGIADQVFNPDTADPSPVIAAETPGLKHVGMKLEYSDVVSPAGASDYMYMLTPAEERPALYVPISVPTGEYAIAGPYYAFSRPMNTIDTYSDTDFTGVRVKGTKITVQSIAAFQAGGNISGLVSAGVVANPPAVPFYSHARLAEQESNPQHELVNLPLYSAKTSLRLPSLGPIRDTFKKNDAGESETSYNWIATDSAYTTSAAGSATIFSTVDASQNQPSTWIFPGTHANPFVDIDLTAYFTGVSNSSAFLDVWYSDATVAGTGARAYTTILSCQTSPSGADTQYQISASVNLRSRLPAGFETAPILGFTVRLVAFSGTLAPRTSLYGTVKLELKRYRQMDLYLGYVFIRQVPQTFVVSASSTVDLIMSATSEKSFGQLVDIREIVGDADALIGFVARIIQQGGYPLVYRGPNSDPLPRATAILDAATRIGRTWGLGDIWGSVKKLATGAWNAAKPYAEQVAKPLARYGLDVLSDSGVVPGLARPLLDYARGGLTSAPDKAKTGLCCFVDGVALPVEQWGFCHRAAIEGKIPDGCPADLVKLLEDGKVQMDLHYSSSEGLSMRAVGFSQSANSGKPGGIKRPAPQLRRIGFTADSEPSMAETDVKQDEPPAPEDQVDEESVRKVPFWYVPVTDRRLLAHLVSATRGRPSRHPTLAPTEVHFVQFASDTPNEPFTADGRTITGRVKMLGARTTVSGRFSDRPFHLVHQCRTKPSCEESSECSCSLALRALLVRKILSTLKSTGTTGMTMEAPPKRRKAHERASEVPGAAPSAAQPNPGSGTRPSPITIDELLKAAELDLGQDGLPSYLAPWRNKENQRAVVSGGAYYGAPFNFTASSASFYASIAPAPTAAGQDVFSYAVAFLSTAPAKHFVDFEQQLAEVKPKWVDIVVQRPKDAQRKIPLVLHVDLSYYVEAEENKGSTQEILDYIAEVFPTSLAGLRARRGELGKSYVLGSDGRPEQVADYTTDVYLQILPVLCNNISGKSCMFSLGMAMNGSAGSTMVSGAMVKSGENWVAATVKMFDRKVKIAAGQNLVLSICDADSEPADLDDFDRIFRGEQKSATVFAVPNLATAAYFEAAVSARYVHLGMHGSPAPIDVSVLEQPGVYDSLYRRATEKNLLNTILTDNTMSEDARATKIRNVIVSQIPWYLKNLKKQEKSKEEVPVVTSDMVADFNARAQVLLSDFLEEVRPFGEKAKQNRDDFATTLRIERERAAGKLGKAVVNDFFKPLDRIRKSMDNVVAGFRKKPTAKKMDDPLSKMLNFNRESKQQPPPPPQPQAQPQSGAGPSEPKRKKTKAPGGGSDQEQALRDMLSRIPPETLAQYLSNASRPAGAPASATPMDQEDDDLGGM